MNRKRIVTLALVFLLLAGMTTIAFGWGGGSGGAWGAIRDYFKRINTTAKPAADATYDLGSTARGWDQVYLSGVNAAGGSKDVLTLDGTLGIMNNSDTFRGLYLNYTNANHTGSGNTVYGLDIAGITQDDHATETAIHIGSGWDNALDVSGAAIIGGDITISDTTPVLNYKDSSCTDADVNASIQADATATGTNAETVDITIKTQVGGVEKEMFQIDSDLEIIFNEDSCDVNVVIETDTTEDYLVVDAGTDATSWETAVTAAPIINFTNNTNDATATIVTFDKDRSGAGAVDAVDGDDIATYLYKSYDDGTPTANDYAKVVFEISDSAIGAEDGKYTLQACVAGTLTDRIVVDGAASTTIAATTTAIINPTTDIILDPEGLDVIIGDSGNEDYTLQFTGDTSTGIITYDEDNADFKFDQDIHTTAGIDAEDLYSSDDADIVDNLTAGDIAIDEAAGVLAFTGATSGTISSSSAGCELIIDMADAADGTQQSYVTISGVIPAHTSATPTDIMLDINPTIGIPTVDHNFHVIDMAFTSPAYATSGKTNNARAIYIQPSVGNASDGTNAFNVIEIGTMTGDAEVTTRGLYMGAMTGTGATENAIEIGPGWDAGLKVGGATENTLPVIQMVGDADSDGGGVITSETLQVTLTANATPTAAVWAITNTQSAGYSFDDNITAVGSFIIGSADMNEADLEKLDGITNGTAAASKALVLDAGSDITTGLDSFTATTLTDGTASLNSGALTGITTAITGTKNNALTISIPGQSTDSAAGQGMTISADDGGSGGTGYAGGAMLIEPGAAAGSGNNSGGILTLRGGAKSASGADGYVRITDATDTPTQTLDDESLYVVGKLEVDGMIHADGGVTGALTGNADTATLAATVTIADNEATNENNAIVFLPGGDLDGGNLALECDGSPFTYNPSSGTCTATTFAGALTGNADTCTTASAGDAAIDFFGAGVDAVTDTTTCTDIEGTLLSITGSTLNCVEAQTLAAVLALGADGNDVDQTSLGKLSFFDAGLYLDADADGVMDITSDGTLELHSADWDISATGAITNAAIDADNNTVSNIAIGAECTGASTDLTDTANILLLDTGGTLTANVITNANLSVGNAATTAGVLTLLEDDDDGANFASFMVPALAANTVYTLPADDGDNLQVLQTNGSGTLDWVAAGTGDITDVWGTASGDANQLTIGESEYLIGGAVDGTTDPYISLPQGADVSSVVGEGRISWDSDNDNLYVGDGAAVVHINSASATLYDDIGNPDAASSISFDDEEHVTYSFAQNTAGSCLTLLVSTVDVGNEVHILQLDHNDDADADADFIICRDDADGAPATMFEVEYNGDVTVAGNLVLSGQQLNQYYAVNDGNTLHRIGSGVQEVCYVQAVYSSGTQVMQNFILGSHTNNAAADAGYCEFLVDDIIIFKVDDDGIEMQGGKGIEIGAHLACTPDAITATDAGVAASIATVNTEVTTNGDSDLDNVTLADGSYDGQIKHIYCVVEANASDTWKITPTELAGGTQITFDGIGQGCTLVYDSTTTLWIVTAKNGGTIS